MSNPVRLDVFEPGDLTALVCLDVPAMQSLVVDQLSELQYKIHTGFSADDLVLKLRTQAYDIVVVAENFGGVVVEENPILHEAVNAPASTRRKQFLILVGASFSTNDEMQAFRHSVDMVIALSDVVHLRPILRRGLARTQEFYGAFYDAIENAGVA